VADTLTVGAMEPSAAPATYTIANIARLAQCSERHAWRLADLDLIPGRIKGLGRLVRFSKCAVDAWLAGKQTGR
jgi:predicted DNA-binding transcriptional regulator AlpA